MNAVTLSVPITSILSLFPELPAGGSISRVYLSGEEIKVEYDHRDIVHPRDYPLEYEEWLRLPALKPLDVRPVVVERLHVLRPTRRKR